MKRPCSRHHPHGVDGHSMYRMPKTRTVHSVFVCPWSGCHEYHPPTRYCCCSMVQPRGRVQPLDSLVSHGGGSPVWVYVTRMEHVTAMLECGMLVGDRCWLVVEEGLVKEGVLDDWSATLGGSLGTVVVLCDDASDASTDSAARRPRVLRLWEDGCVGDGVIGEYSVVSCADDLKRVEAMQDCCSNKDGTVYVVVDARDWKIIPVENLIAAFQQSAGNIKLIMTVDGVEDAMLMKDVMEHGTDGIMLRGLDVHTVHDFRDYVFEELDAKGNARDAREYSVGTVTRVEPLGLGDRICVDLAENMVPGQGFLLSSFARGFFLVHSECEETSYINSRPFRVNAGPVHSYIELGEKTGYLSELQSGSQVTIFDHHGNSKHAIVGRVKMERRPLILIEAVGTESGDMYSIMLQNAETVKLVGPDGDGFRTISVSHVQQGDDIYLFEYRDGGARHAGMQIKESIREY